MQNIVLTTPSVEMDTILAMSRTFTFESFQSISWISLINSGIVISFGQLGLRMVSVLIRPQRNLLRLPTNQAIFRCLDMSGTAGERDHVPSIGTSNNRTAPYLGNTAGGVGLPI